MLFIKFLLQLNFINNYILIIIKENYLYFNFKLLIIIKFLQEHFQTSINYKNPKF